MSRRKKRLLITIIAGGLFLVLAIETTWLFRSQEETYVPGADITGLTRTLERAVPDDAPRITFADVTKEAGIDFSHFSGRRTSQIPEDMGSGAAWGDYDNDGWQDLYVVNMIGPITLTEEVAAESDRHNVLYRNNGDGSFTDVSRTAGVDARGWGSGAAWGDYDGDGDIDLFATFYGENRLYRNNGDGTFSETTKEAAVGGRRGFWMGVSWSDYDRDGWLDLYVTGYIRYESGVRTRRTLQYSTEQPSSINPSSFEPERNLLYRNNGDGTFTEVAEAAGVANTEGRSLSASWADFDDDGWPDLYVANDVSDNVLYRNYGDGTFDDVSLLALVADYRGAMGLAVGDWDGDLDLDLFVTHWIAQENALYSSMRIGESGRSTSVVLPMRFTDVADRYGLGQIALDYVGWGTSFFDYDNDGRPDLLVVNGSTLQQAEAPHLLVGMRDMIFWNGGPERGFFDVSGIAGPHFTREYVGRGAAFADYDNDGNVDVFIVNHGGNAVLLNNRGESANHWLKIVLRGSTSNSRGIGARIRVTTADAVAIQEVGSQSSYLSQNSAEAHFGLGNATQVEAVEVRWPSGRTSLLSGIAADERIIIQETDSRE